MDLHVNINLNGPLTPDLAAKAARAQEIRQRAENVLSALKAPDDSFQADAHGSNDGLGIYAFKGKIGPEQFAQASVIMKDGGIDSLAAHDPAAKPGETVKFHLSSARADGMRAAIASGFGSVGGALGNAAAYLLAKAITTYPSHKVAGKMLELASHPFSGASDLARYTEHKLAYTSEKERNYALAGADGSYEQICFHNDNTVDYEYFAKV
ncbi:MAG: hypothetical protein U0931_38810 [Vulcanimicrobiota bacterium]